MDVFVSRDSEAIIPNIFFFLVLLSYERYHSKQIIGIPKIIQLCDGIMASGRKAVTHGNGTALRCGSLLAAPQAGPRAQPRVRTALLCGPVCVRMGACARVCSHVCACARGGAHSLLGGVRTYLSKNRDTVKRCAVQIGPDVNTWLREHGQSHCRRTLQCSLRWQEARAFQACAPGLSAELLSPAIPALQPIVHDLFVLRGTNKADAGKELETQKEVVVSMLLRLIQYHQVRARGRPVLRHPRR